MGRKELGMTEATYEQQHYIDLIFTLSCLNLWGHSKS